MADKAGGKGVQGEARESFRGSAVSAGEMKRIDAAAIEDYGIPRILLMEHAGFSLAGAVMRALSDAGSGAQARVVLLCGGGYNGGDGLACARHLHNAGLETEVLLTADPEALREEPRIFFGLARRLGVRIDRTDALGPGELSAHLARADLVVDALLGIGIEGAVRDSMRALIDAVNAAGRPVVSADIPSGLNADTGSACGAAVRAMLTVTFGLPKKGCVAAGAEGYVGRLEVASIGFPPELLRPKQR